MKHAMIAAVLVAAIGMPVIARASADNEASPPSVGTGKAVFARCTMCHSDKPNVRKIGPSLYGVMNRPSASVANFAYSPAMRMYNRKWDAQTLDAFLANPKAEIPNTSMGFTGVKSVKDRQALIAYLAMLK